MRNKEWSVFRKTTAVILTATLVVISAGCGKGGNAAESYLSNEDGSGSVPSGIPGGGKWVDSDVSGMVKQEDNIRLQDDFAAAANKDYILSAVMDPAYEEASTVFDASKLVYERCMAIASDDTMTDDNAEKYKAVVKLHSDWDERNRLGVEPLKKYISDKSVMLDELCLQYKDASSFDVLERINYRILPENIWSDLRLMVHYEQLMHYFEESPYEGIVFEMTEKELNVLTQCTLRAHDAIGPIGAKIWDTVWASDDYQEFISLLTRTMVNINRSNVIKTRIFGTDKLEPEEYIFPTDYWFKVQCLF